jgi:CRISPR-associated protein Cas2
MNTSYIILLFYDIPNNDKIERERYTKFNNFIKSIGFIMLQESVYMKSISNKQTYKPITRDLKLIAPDNSNIRTILITQNNFE